MAVTLPSGSATRTASCTTGVAISGGYTLNVADSALTLLGSEPHASSPESWVFTFSGSLTQAASATLVCVS